jgi:hypothetical protein
MYAIEFQGKAFTPTGKTDIPDVAAHNAELERRELEWLKTGPDKVFLYVRHAGWSGPEGTDSLGIPRKSWSHTCKIVTWMGTVLDDHAWIGSQVRDNFGGKRAAITARIFGTLYHGWYFESSGDYCRLKRAKRQ